MARRTLKYLQKTTFVKNIQDTHLDVRDAVPVGVLHQVPGLLPRHDPVLDDHLAVLAAAADFAAAFLTLGQLLEVVDVDGLGLLAPVGVLVAAVEEGLHTPGGRFDAVGVFLIDLK